MPKLTPKQEMFCTEYIIDFNGTQAAIRAGYSKKTANEQASRLLTKTWIKQRIEFLRSQIKKDKRYIEGGTSGKVGVYVVHETGGHYYKIGCTRSIKTNRLSGVQTGNPRELKLRLFIPTIPNKAIALEKLLHKKFAENRVRGEWFVLTKKQLDKIIKIRNKIIKQNDSLFSVNFDYLLEEKETTV